MPEFKNRFTRVHKVMTDEFRSSLKDLPKKKVPPFGAEFKDARHNPIRKTLEDAGIKMRTLKKLEGNGRRRV